MTKRRQFVLMLSCLAIFALVCGCGEQEGMGVDGGEYTLVCTVGEISDPLVLATVEEDSAGTFAQGETVAMEATELEEASPDEFSTLEVGDTICLTYLRVSQEGPPPVLFVVGWSSDFT